ncbi:hypothetical protein G3601_005360 [Salmonella enterica]|nr:hypothetical protein [Salmonella enterica]EDH5493270.1 hypothetical protein [Salmonella enterica subsp. enterica serovar Java]EDX3987257.1 hypothetical protein [Salmonella enterica subsp. enterica serovar 4,[5],12:b:-]EEE5613347.1 hypothetical protein [Salmonella enterica subsp. enterica serovar Typhimurium]EIM5533426.1 hypothetical protein [Salmonella enterica subsp. enterica]ELD8112373.1 hypothetical protein [Salmonella enterica subsp. enterica serovar Benin]
MAQQVTDGLWGTPDDIVSPDKNIWISSACLPYSCTEKAAYITDGYDELFALTGYMCPTTKGRIDYKNDGCLSLFYHDQRAEKVLSPAGKKNLYRVLQYTSNIPSFIFIKFN